MSQNADPQAFDAVFSILMDDLIVSITLREIAHLGIADLLSDGPKSVSALAQEVGVQADVLQLFLRLLSSKDIFVETQVGIFDHTERSRCLQADIPGSIRNFAELLRSEWQRMSRTPEALTYTLRTGQPALEHILGESLWSYLTRHPSEYNTFSKTLTEISLAQNERMAPACDLTGLHALVDIGGGEGSFLMALLRLHPETTGILFDAPPVIEKAQALLAQSGLTDRCTCIAGDFFQSVPAGGDAYFIKNVLHDWSDEDCLRILRNCRQAIAPTGKLFIIEHILPEPPAKPSPYLAVSVVFRQLLPGGRQRTVQEFRHLLDNAGFTFVSLTPTSSPNSVLVAEPQD